MNLMSRTTVLAALVAGMVTTFASSAKAYVWSSTDPYTNWSNGGYVVSNDIWGASPGNQTIYANSYSNWWVICKYSGSGIKSYPHVGKTINRTVTSLGSLRGSFNATTPSGVAHDLAYDIWLNGSTYEVMIWQKWSGTKPIAGSYDASGNAVPTYTNVSIGGIYYDVYKRGNVMSFLRRSQVSSASGDDIREVLLYCNRKGWYNNPTLRDVQFGWEIINTGGVQKQFTMNSFSLTYN